MNSQLRNPFEYDAATNLTDEMVADYFIDDFNYSRFIQSRRNIFVVGERGSGKTMALLFSSYRIQRLIATRQGQVPSLDHIGIYVPCNTPLMYKPEFELLDPFLSAVLSEHLFVLSIAHAAVSTLADIPNILDDVDEASLREELSTVLAAELSEEVNIFQAIRRFLERQILDTQRTAASRRLGAFHEETFSFASLVVPLLSFCQRDIPATAKTHFLLLVDDAQALHKLQLEALNSWIAFRDHSLFSFKIATTKVARTTRRTTSGGSILEGHDYTTIDLERPLHNRNTGFYKLARRIIGRRLEEVDISATPEEFFPVNPAMAKDLEEAKAETRSEAIAKYGPSAPSKTISDYVYKYSRARYFRRRSAQANRAPYSGFETMVYISTGVIRNLLEPCYWMFDRAVSARSYDSSVPMASISPSIQTEIILERSDDAWTRLGELANDIEGCSIENGQRAYRLVDALAAYFRARLLGDGSEPSAVSFTISRATGPAMPALRPILDILRSAQMVYVRIGTAKDGGRREWYFVPSRILWPSRGLDPHGQHARVSLTSDTLWRATETGRIDLPKDQESDTDATRQEEFWSDSE